MTTRNFTPPTTTLELEAWRADMSLAGRQAKAAGVDGRAREQTAILQAIRDQAARGPGGEGRL